MRTLAGGRDILLSWPGKQVCGTIIIKVRRQRKGYSFADFLWLPEKQGTEVASIGLSYPRPCVQKQCRYGLVLGFHCTLPRAFLVRFSSAAEVIRGCKGQHNITNTVRQERDWNTSNGALLPVRTPMFTNAPPFGVPDRQRLSDLIDHGTWPWRLWNNRKTNGKRQHFFFMATIPIIWICQLLTCTSAYSPRQLENLTARFQESEMLQTRKLLGWVEKIY